MIKIHNRKNLSKEKIDRITTNHNKDPKKAFILSLTDFVREKGVNIFGTHTYRYSCNLKSIRRTAKTFHQEVKNGKALIFPEPDFLLFWFAEPHQAKNSFHFHSLFTLRNNHPNEVWDYWFKKYGRGRFEYIEPDKGAEYYCTKYCLKHNSDYDILF